MSIYNTLSSAQKGLNEDADTSTGSQVDENKLDNEFKIPLDQMTDTLFKESDTISKEGDINRKQ